MELNTASLGVFTRLAGVIFEKALDAVPKNIMGSGLFVEENIPNNSGETRDFQEIDLELYASNKDQGDQAARGKVQLGYNKLVTVKRVAKDIGITYEMRQFNKYPEVVRRLTNLAQMPMNRLELDLSHRIGFGTATSYTDKDGATVDITVGDSLALFSTVHTLTGSSSTYRNRLAGNPLLSKGALEGIERLAVEETLNNFGEKVKYKHVKLPLVPTNADGSVDNTKRRYWGIASSMMSDAHLGIWESPHLKSPSNLNAGEEFSTDDWNFGVRAGYGIGIVTGRWIRFSSGDGAA